MDDILSILTFLPLVAALILIVFLRGDDAAAQQNAKWLALVATCATFLVAVALVVQFDPGAPGFQFVEARPWLFGFTYRVGVDGISVLMVVMAAFVMPLAVLASWDMTLRIKELMVAYLLLESLIIGAFVALDIALFFVFAEAALLPLFVIIGIWGGKTGLYVAFKTFVVGAIGAIALLIAVVAVAVDAGTTCLAACEGGVALLEHRLPTEPTRFLGIEVAAGAQGLVWFALLIGLAAKLPLWPLHTWLPAATEHTPTAGSFALTALFVKLGAYGLLRLGVPMFPVAVELYAPLVMWIAAIAVLYAGLVALSQTDMKQMFAYSAVAHMAMVTAGIMAATRQGLDGAIFHMIGHGVISTALFLCAGVVFDRRQSYEIEAYGGLRSRMPAYATVFLLFLVAHMGLPGTAGFAGLFLVLTGLMQAHTGAALAMCLGLVLFSAAAFWLYRRVVLGDLIKEGLKTITDLSGREKLIFAPLVIVTLCLGLFPTLITDITGPATTALVDMRADDLAAWSAEQLGSDTRLAVHRPD